MAYFVLEKSLVVHADYQFTMHVASDFFNKLTADLFIVHFDTADIEVSNLSSIKIG